MRMYILGFFITRTDWETKYDLQKYYTDYLIKKYVRTRDEKGRFVKK
jgi:hypothetical protein